MSVDFSNAAKKAYGFTGNPLLLLRFLCDEISYKSRDKYLKSRWGWVCRSYGYLAFRCGCSEKTISLCVKALRTAGVVKTFKKGPHHYYNFGVSLDRLEDFRREWKDEKKEYGQKIAEAFEEDRDADPMDISEMLLALTG